MDRELREQINSAADEYAMAERAAAQAQRDADTIVMRPATSVRRRLAAQGLTPDEIDAWAKRHILSDDFIVPAERVTPELIGSIAYLVGLSEAEVGTLLHGYVAHQ